MPCAVLSYYQSLLLVDEILLWVFLLLSCIALNTGYLAGAIMHVCDLFRDLVLTLCQFHHSSALLCPFLLWVQVADPARVIAASGRNGR